MSPIDLTPLHALLAVRRARASSIHDMPGGASTRRYFRVVLDDGTSVVGMFVPEGDKPEEIARQAMTRRWPFLEVRDLLASHRIRVPGLLAEDTARGWLLLEDLGDDTLASALARTPENKPTFYARAVKDLARAQEVLAVLPEDSIVRTRAFDADLLRLELDHFREWGLDARGRALGSEDRVVFDTIADRLARRIAGWPRGFTHRDYQSRNLMVVEARAEEAKELGQPYALAWIDFQDALLGPRVYDLVALLSDSYQEFDDAFVEARLDEYAAGAGLASSARRALRREFDLVTVQRKLKDAGRFVFIDRVKKNPAFLPFVTPTVRKVACALRRLEAEDPDMNALARILRGALPDEMA